MRVRVGFAVVLSLVAFASAAFAQGQTGSIAGVVQGHDRRGAAGRHRRSFESRR